MRLQVPDPSKYPSVDHIKRVSLRVSFTRSAFLKLFNQPTKDQQAISLVPTGSRISFYQLSRQAPPQKW
ncbi:hypothetical protein Pdw03_6633 [Penicillium digitatum]|uniref:Uncharacterized protein n=1 Tax=Penicillium digitatum TaxID=36651 RepID=A0A7T6XKL8_PENDI|nr:hypothetical protein Pdw03_6633 [Penicillium digitatum]